MKKNQILIIAAVIVAVVLITVLVFSLTNNSNPTDESPADNVSSTADVDSEVESQTDSETTPKPDSETTPKPDSETTPKPDSETTPKPELNETPEPSPVPQPDPEANGLPADWNQLSNQEKIALNPLGCDLETQWIATVDGTCLAKMPTEPPIDDDIRLIRVEHDTIVALNINDALGNELPFTLEVNYSCQVLNEVFNTLLADLNTSQAALINEYRAYLALEADGATDRYKQYINYVRTGRLETYDQRKNQLHKGITFIENFIAYLQAMGITVDNPTESLNTYLSKYKECITDLTATKVSDQSYKVECDGSHPISRSQLTVQTVAGTNLTSQYLFAPSFARAPYLQEGVSLTVCERPIDDAIVYTDSQPFILASNDSLAVISLDLPVDQPTLVEFLITSQV